MASKHHSSLRGVGALGEMVDSSAGAGNIQAEPKHHVVPENTVVCKEQCGHVEGHRS